VKSFDYRGSQYKIGRDHLLYQNIDAASELMRYYLSRTLATIYRPCDRTWHLRMPKQFLSPNNITAFFEQRVPFPYQKLHTKPADLLPR